MCVCVCVSAQAVSAAFERVDAAIEAWQLNTVPEECESVCESDEGEDTQADPDMTFLTGVCVCVCVCVCVYVCVCVCHT